MNFLSFRLDCDAPGVTRENVCSFLTRHSGEHCVAFEISEKTKKEHYQGWVYTTQGIQTFRNNMTATWPSIKGVDRKSTGLYSCAPVKKDTYKAYCLKGTPTELPQIVSGQIPIGYDLENEHRKWWSNNALTSPKTVHIVEEGIAVFGSVEWEEHVTPYRKRYVVASWLVDKYKGKGQNSFLLKNYINGILNEVCPDHRTEFVNQIANSERW